MKFIYIIILFCGFYLNEKFYVISPKNFKNIIKNIILVLPFITIYFSQDNIVNILNKKKFKRKVSGSNKKIIASNQQWKCAMCNNLLNYSYEIDHIIPLYKGGTNDNYNLQALCRNCHGIKTLNDRNNY